MAGVKTHVKVCFCIRIIPIPAEMSHESMPTCAVGWAVAGEAARVVTVSAAAREAKLRIVISSAFKCEPELPREDTSQFRGK